MSRHDVLISGLNWVGDSIMAMPALQVYRDRNEDVRIAMLVKPNLASLWSMHEGISTILQLGGGLRGARRAARQIRALGCHTAYVWPHSFRSALVPFLAKVPRRIGMTGPLRNSMLTKRVIPCLQPDRLHQSYEYIDLMVPDWGGEQLPAPALSISKSAVGRAQALLKGGGDRWIGLMPGAARGPSKRWPRGHFVDLGRRLAREQDVSIAVMGTPGEADLCREVAHGIGEKARSLAGHTTFDVWAAALAACDAVVANDSGGMHLAAAIGTPVVALYGLTDPDKTGPMGPARILRHSPKGARDIARDSAKARSSLASIEPGDVQGAVEQFLSDAPGS